MLTTMMNTLNNILLALSGKDTCELSFYDYKNTCTIIGTVNELFTFQTLLDLANETVKSANKDFEELEYQTTFNNNLLSFSIAGYEMDEEDNLIKYVTTVKYLPNKN